MCGSAALDALATSSAPRNSTSRFRQIFQEIMQSLNLALPLKMKQDCHAAPVHFAVPRKLQDHRPPLPRNSDSSLLKTIRQCHPACTLKALLEWMSARIFGYSTHLAFVGN